MKADLHCHTKLSDGTMGIDDLIILAKNSGVTTLAITDHDCLAGTVRAELIGKRHDINVIPAVEFSGSKGFKGAPIALIAAAALAVIFARLGGII